jgi:hypothetical protein
MVGTGKKAVVDYLRCSKPSTFANVKVADVATRIQWKDGVRFIARRNTGNIKREINGNIDKK